MIEEDAVALAHAFEKTGGLRIANAIPVRCAGLELILPGPTAGLALHQPMGHRSSPRRDGRVDKAWEAYPSDAPLARSTGAESSGQRGRGAKSKPSLRPRRKRSMPAQAIIAALSVHSRGGGATNGSAASAATAERVTRNLAFAATPPAMTSAVKGMFSRRQWFSARPVRSAKVSATRA